MPFIGSQFLTRGKGDRPQVVPNGSTNLAFIGQYAEVPNDTVFTVEYSVRSAQIAVFTLLNLKRKVNLIYRGMLSPAVRIRSIKPMYKKSRIKAA